MDGKVIEGILKKQVNSSIRLPQGITFVATDNSVTLILSENAIGLGKGALNMQKDAAAFEGWAIALYVHFLHANGIVILNAVIPEQHKNQFDGKHGHYNRFLFRVMKFSEQFGSWFRVSTEIEEAVASFKAFLADDSFVNNIGESEAGSNGNLENIVEGLLADEKMPILHDVAKASGVSLRNPIYRQLSTGLFKKKKSEETRIFTGGKSAIDLWTEQDNTIFIFELKARNNKVGMITELFFYANYVYDMFCDKATTFVPLLGKGSKDHRGYDALLSPDGHKTHNRVQALFLSDQRHPLITPEVVDLLNTGTEGIAYQWLAYSLDIVVEKTAGTSVQG